jgi:hypothetical protein
MVSSTYFIHEVFMLSLFTHNILSQCYELLICDALVDKIPIDVVNGNFMDVRVAIRKNTLCY